MFFTQFKSFIVALLLIVPAAGYAQQSQVEPERDFYFGRNMQLGGMPTISIVSYEDELVITKLFLNRGQCVIFDNTGKLFPVKLKYSQKVTIGFYGKTWQTDCSDIKELVFETNFGVWRYKK